METLNWRLFAVSCKLRWSDGSVPSASKMGGYEENNGGRPGNNIKAWLPDLGHGSGSRVLTAKATSLINAQPE